MVTAAQARDVLVGEDGLLSTGREGLTVVILSTVQISQVRELAALCTEHGATLLDAGVTRGGEGGTLVTMIDGPDDAVGRASAGGVSPGTILDVFRATATGGPTPTTMLEGQVPEDRWERGVEMMQRVYGDPVVDAMPKDGATPATVDMVEHLFGEIWARPHLTLRDRRLLALGATAMLGRADLLKVQLRGAMKNGELTDEQLREIELFLLYYAGVENDSSVLTTIEKLIAEREGRA